MKEEPSTMTSPAATRTYCSECGWGPALPVSHSEMHAGRSGKASGPSVCRICGDAEPHHVHQKGERREDYFTVGRGQTDFEAALSWQGKYSIARRNLQALVKESSWKELYDLAVTDGWDAFNAAVDVYR